MRILIFGKLGDIVHSSDLILEIENPIGIDSFKTLLFEIHPALMQEKFAISVNQKLSTDDTMIHNNDEIALLPPFSGG